MSGGGKGGGEQTVGYRYYFGIHAGIGRGPVDELVEIRVGGKLAARPAMTASGQGTINAGDLFGGDKKEGGIEGTFNLMMGEPTQTMPAALASMISPAPATGFRRMVTFFYDGLISALNPYPKPWSFRIRRALEGWDGEVLRPDLAVIALQGQAPPEGGSGGSGGTSPAYGPSMMFTMTAVMPGPPPSGDGPAVEMPEYFAVTVVPPSGSLLGTIGRVYHVTDTEHQMVEIPYDVVGGNEVRIAYATLRFGGDLVIEYNHSPALSAAVAAVVNPPDATIKAMNPAHIIYECLTNREWGRGLDRSAIDTASFSQAAEVLFAEQFGMCLKWSRRDSIDSFIQEVLDTCGAALYMSRTEAKLTLKLIRKDYVVSSLPIWDTTNGILRIANSTVNTSANVINEVIVKYREAVYNEDRSVNVQNLASLQSTGGVFKTMTSTYKGIPTSELARRVAQRDLRASAEGLRRFNIVMDRRGSDITPGQVMRIQDVARNIAPMVVRVATVKYGTSGSGELQLSVIQDVFAFPEASFSAEQPNVWQTPNFTPCIGQHEVFEVPYFLLARNMSAADFGYVDNASAYAMAVAEQAKSSNVGFDIAVRSTEPTTDDWPLDGEAAYCGFDPVDAPI